MSIEAMKQALEALCLTNNEAVPYDIEKQREAAIEALRQAIEQAEKQEPLILDRGCYERGCIAYDERDGDGITMKQERVDKTVKREHEPVAWITDGGKGDLGWRKTIEKDIPLYTAPPKKEWVGLTHEERFLNDCRSQEEIEYAIAIEAKLKEKNS